jgi:hypothetical protein
MFNIQRKETTMSSKQVEFYLDPGCPWTWLTSRWLVDVAAQRGDLEIAWRPFSLALLNAGRPVPPQFDTSAMREKRSVADRALRVLTVLGEDEQHEPAGRFYTEFGRRFHDGDGGPGDDPVAAAAKAAGIGDAVDVAKADTVDDAVARHLADALAAAGPDVGSPVLRIDGSARAFHGPIVSPRVGGDAALRLFDAIAILQAESGFYEIKRGRSGPPALGGAR